MTSTNGNAPGLDPRGVSAEPLPSDEVGSQRIHRTAPAVLVGYAIRYRRVRNQLHDWANVKCCPLCGHAHRHVIFEENTRTIERAPACAPHRRYVVEIVDVVPAEASLGRAA